MTGWILNAIDPDGVAEYVYGDFAFYERPRPRKFSPIPKAPSTSGDEGVMRGREASVPIAARAPEPHAIPEILRRNWKPL